MLELIAVLIAVLAAVAGYAKSREFVRERLQFVDAVQRPIAPWIAGGAAALAVSPVAWILPYVGGGAALLFGAAVGYGVARGRRDIRQLPPG